MAGLFVVFLLTGFPLGFLFPFATIVSAYLKPKRAEGDWIQFLQFWFGVAGFVAMVATSIAGGVPLLAGTAITTLVLAGALLLILSEALAGRRQAALIDLGLLFLVSVIGYPFFAATLH